MIPLHPAVVDFATWPAQGPPKAPRAQLETETTMPRLMTALQIGVLSLAPLAASAQEKITIEAADGYRFIRCVDMMGFGASCEFLSASDGILNCVAFDRNGEPMAVTAAMGEGPALFQGVAARDVDNMICE